VIRAQDSASTTPKSRWLRCRKPRPDARLRLICFPQAGGAASFFGSWAARLPAELELHAVQYPGREDRVQEACIDDMAVLAAEIATALRPLSDRPMALFGHSMGAAVAYEVARLLNPGPVCLFVSGRHAPSELLHDDVHLRNDEDVLDELKRLGGTDATLLDDPELREMILPMVRSDFKLAETYRHLDGSRLACPIISLVGLDDPEVTTAQARRWQEHTTGSFTQHTFPGDHFYLMAHQERVVDLVISQVASYSAQ
jgi:pyochelin biosynthetic protein PchC